MKAARVQPGPALVAPGVLVVLLLALLTAGGTLASAGPPAAGAPDGGPAARGAAAHTRAATAGRILFVRSGSLWSCRPDGGGQTRLAKCGDGAVAAAWSPDRRSIVFSRYDAKYRATLWRMDADGGGQRKLSYSGPSLTQDCGGLAWSPDGDLLAGGNFNGSSGHVALLDLRTMTSRNLFTLRPSPNGIETLSWSPDQAQLLVAQEGGDSSWLVRIDASSGALLQNYDGKQRGIGSASYSPRGDRIAYSYGDLSTGRHGIRIAKVDGTPVRSLSHGPQWDPWWSSDGKRIAFTGEQGVFVIGVDGKGKRQIVKGGWAVAWR